MSRNRRGQGVGGVEVEGVVVEEDVEVVDVGLEVGVISNPHQIVRLSVCLKG